MSDPITRLNAALEGRYRIERELGEGGMATVYLATDLRHERRVALKVLRPELAAVIGGERFVAEIKTTAALQHPHILPLFDSGEADGFLYYVMPFVEGESLRVRLDRERQLEVEESLHIAKAVASALQYAHERDVIHRDIKPENILLHAGEPVVADFGIALAISAAGGGRLTETGLSLGTPHYMSPEQAAADRDLSARSDVYSLACVLYEMLAGQPPHTGPTAQSILVRILTEDPRPVTDLRPTVPRHVRAVVSKGLEKLPADRFKSAEELRAALDDPAFTYERTKRTGPQVGAALPAAEAASRPTRRAWSWLHATATAVLALATVWLGLTRASDPTPEVGYGAVVSFVALDSAATVDALNVARDGTVAYLRDGTIHVRPPGALEAETLAGVDDVSEFAFSPEGDWLVFATPLNGPTQLRKVQTGGGPVANVWNGGDAPAYTPHWGEDGWIYFVSGSGGAPTELRRVPDVGGEAELLLTVEGSFAFSPHLLPGARGLVYTSSNTSITGGRLMLLDLETRDTTEIVAEGFQARWSPTGHLVYGHESGALWAVPLDLADLSVAGPPAPALEGVGTLFSFAVYGLSRSGTLAFVTGTGSGDAAAGAGAFQFALVSEDGALEVLPIEPTDHYDVRISPDGATLAYTRENDIWMFDLDRGTLVALTEGRTGQHNPIWSPDGSRIVYRSDDDLLARRVDRSAPPDSVTSTDQADNPVEWLEDGTIIVGTQGAREGDLVAVRIDSEEPPRPLLNANWMERGASISPDGRWMAYMSGRSGTVQLYVRSWPELSGETMVSSGEGDLEGFWYPQWSPDGRTLYYQRGSSILAAEVHTDAGFEVVSTRTLPVQAIGVLQDIHPDGRLLMAVTPQGGPGRAEAGAVTPRLVVVANWLTELTSRLGGG